METIGKVLRRVTGWKEIGFVADHDAVFVLDGIAQWTDDQGARRELGTLSTHQLADLESYYARIDTIV